FPPLLSSPLLFIFFPYTTLFRSSILILAGLCETFAVAMINQLSVKQNWQTIVLIILGLGSALGLLSYSLQSIPMGTGYAIWTGISVVGSSLIGMIYFGESKD